MLILIEDAYLRIAVIISLVLNLVAFAAAYVAFAGSSDLLVIHFDVYKGIDFLGIKTDVFGFLSVGVVVNIVNFILAAAFYYRERFLSRFLAYFSVFFSLLILIATAVIISVN